MTQWIEACATNAIKHENLIRFVHDGRTFALYRGPDDEYFCTDNLCTREAVYLEHGLVMDYAIECPKHGGEFDYRTGEALRAPACADLNTYPTMVAGGRVFIGI